MKKSWLIFLVPAVGGLILLIALEREPDPAPDASRTPRRNEERRREKPAPAPIPKKADLPEVPGEVEAVKPGKPKDDSPRAGSPAEAKDLLAQLTAALQSEDAERIKTVLSLFTRGHAAAVSELNQLLLTSGDPATRENTAKALGRIGDPAAISPLVQIMRRDEEAKVRVAAVRALGGVGGDGVVTPLLEALFNREDVQAGVAASMAIAQARSDLAIGPLMERMRTETDPTTAYLTVKAFAYLRGKESLDTLSRFSSDETASSGARHYSVMMMGRMGGEPALPMLLTMARGEQQDPQVRNAAILALGELRNVPQAAVQLEGLYYSSQNSTLRSQVLVSFARRQTVGSVETIERLYQGESDERLRRNAATALGSVRRPEATALLETIAQQDPSTIVREAAQKILEARKKSETRNPK